MAYATSRRGVSLGVVIAALMVLWVRFVSAQGAAGTGTLQGTVKDPTGAVMQSVAVKVTNAVSGFARTTTTDAAGKFVLTNLPANAYHLSVEAQGFEFKRLQVAFARGLIERQIAHAQRFEVAPHRRERGLQLVGDRRDQLALVTVDLLQLGDQATLGLAIQERFPRYYRYFATPAVDSISPRSGPLVAEPQCSSAWLRLEPSIDTGFAKGVCRAILSMPLPDRSASGDSRTCSALIRW